MSQPGTIGHGMPPRDNDVQREMREMQRQINQMHGALVQAANTANQAAAVANNALSKMTPNNWLSTNFGVTVSGNVVLSKSITVPAGFTQLTFMAVATSSVKNTNTVQDALFTFISVGASNSSGLGAFADAGYNAFDSASLADRLIGLTPGDTIAVTVKLSTAGSNWSSGSSNGANLSLLTIWQP